MAISTNETEAPEPECFGAKQIINTGEVLILCLIFMYFFK